MTILKIAAYLLFLYVGFLICWAVAHEKRIYE